MELKFAQPLQEFTRFVPYMPYVCRKFDTYYIFIKLHYVIPQATLYEETQSSAAPAARLQQQTSSGNNASIPRLPTAMQRGTRSISSMSSMMEHNGPIRTQTVLTPCPLRHRTGSIRSMWRGKQLASSTRARAGRSDNAVHRTTAEARARPQMLRPAMDGTRPPTADAHQEDGTDMARQPATLEFAIRSPERIPELLWYWQHAPS